jgi:PTH1 family peptidyl-tRNA hydrolase
MGLFTKKPIQTSSSAPLYTLGNQKTILLVGLGNPGPEYDGTRHNIGFDSLDVFVAGQDEFGGWVTKKDLRCQLTSATLGSNRVIAIKPTTFMNESGQAVRAVQDFYKISNSNTIVIHDELDIPFGQLRTRVGGGNAGHNGIKSITNHIEDNYGRLRVGIDSEQRVKNNEKDFVLKKFSKAEQAEIPNLYKEVTALLTEYIYGGVLLAETRSFLI